MNSEPHHSRGFTLIELLVVISIIGMLSTIILAAVSTARLKAKDAKVRSEAVQLRNLFEIEKTTDYSPTYNAITLPITTNGTGYEYIFSSPSDCMSTTDSEFKKVCLAIISDSGSRLYVGAFVASWTNYYSIAMALPSSPITWLCMGSSGSLSYQVSGSSPDGDPVDLSPGCLKNP